MTRTLPRVLGITLAAATAFALVASAQDDDDKPAPAKSPVAQPVGARAAPKDDDDAPVPAKPAGANESAKPAVGTKDDDDDAPATPAGAGEAPALDAEQQAAVGIVVAHPRNAKPAQAIAAYGQVLDGAALVADAGRIDVAHAAERAASADATRLQGLYRGDAGASLKTLQAAQVEQARARADVDAAESAFSLRWGALAQRAPAQRRQTIDAVAAGKHLLVRADLLGRRSLGELPTAALLDVDGIGVPARVLGVLPQAAPDLQSVGVLLEVDAPPPGLGAGARIGVKLDGPTQTGVLVPASALVYAEDGAHVYVQLAKNAGDAKLKYAAAKVTLLQAQADGWLVSGIDDDDFVVVHGAGVLWSLQGIGVGAADDDD
jgi:hypothetical protein